MKILFVYPPARDASIPPTGIAYLSSYLLGKGHKVSILDLTARPLSEQELSSKINDFNSYDCIGISAIITAYTFVKDFSRKIKAKFPNLPIVVGNGLSVSCPRTLLENSPVNAIVVDEGELTLTELLENINNRENYKNIKGIWYKDENGNIINTPQRERIQNLDSLPYPAWGMLDIPVYMRNAGPYLEWGFKTGWISAVRGCPFRCGYCSRCFGQKITSRTADSMIDEILEFKRAYKSTHFQVLDDLFMANINLVKDFSRSLIERKIKMTWQCAGRVNFVNEELLKLMKKSGCICVSYGIESGSQKILDNMNKSATVEQSKKAITLTRKANLMVKTPFMFGYIGEDEKTARETVNFIKEMRIDRRQFFFSTPYPGTPLYEWASKNNRIKHDEDTYISLLGNNAEKFLVNLTDMSDDELLKLKAGSEAMLNTSLPLEIKLRRMFAMMYFVRGRLRQFGVIGVLRKIVKRLKNLKNKPKTWNLKV